ncbi:MAG TPA: dienelactone hydrolase family protein [Candidatus Obscuribacterales bacterium]
MPSASTEAAGLLVGLHGWGANAKDLATLAEYMDLSDYELLFVDAPFLHPQGFGGRMWYEFPLGYAFDTTLSDRDDLVQSRQHLHQWLLSLEEQTGIPLGRTFLAGFSQGGAMALDVGMQLPLAGVLVLSGYLHGPLNTPVQPAPPTLLVHGRQDQVVPIQAAHHTRSQLTAAAVPLTYCEFERMGHEIQPAVMEQIQSFVASIAMGWGETP